MSFGHDTEAGSGATTKRDYRLSQSIIISRYSKKDSPKSTWASGVRDGRVLAIRVTLNAPGRAVVRARQGCWATAAP